MADKLRFGIIGCGRVSPKHVEALANNFSKAELVALCDLEEEKAYELSTGTRTSWKQRDLIFPKLLHIRIICRCLADMTSM